MRERDLVNKILARLRADHPDGLWVKLHGGPMQRAGLPDILGVVSGHAIALEVKLPGRPHEVTDLQQYTLDKLAKAGAIAAVVDDVDDARVLVRNVLEGIRAVGG